MPKLLVIKHVPHEGPGTFEQALSREGVDLHAFEVYAKKPAWPDLKAFDGLIVMGGPMSVNEQQEYPFLTKECGYIELALKRGIPLLGVCLGAQLLAHVLGAKVGPLPMKEIGWHPIMREPDADGDALCNAFGQTETVFQWHGETFDLPKKAARLFSAPLCPEQGFRYGKRAYGLQFHIEVNAAIIQNWIKTPVMKKELDELKGVVDPATIKRSIPEHSGRLEMLSANVSKEFAALLPAAKR